MDTPLFDILIDSLDVTLKYLNKVSDSVADLLKSVISPETLLVREQTSSATDSNRTTRRAGFIEIHDVTEMRRFCRSDVTYQREVPVRGDWTYPNTAINVDCEGVNPRSTSEL